MAAASGLGAGARRRADIAARAALRREGARVARAERRRAALALTAAGRQRPGVSDTARAPASRWSAVRSAHLSAARIRVRARPLIGSVRLQSSSIDCTTSWQFEWHPPAVPDTHRSSPQPLARSCTSEKECSAHPAPRLCIHHQAAPHRIGSIPAAGPPWPRPSQGLSTHPGSRSSPGTCPPPGLACSLACHPQSRRHRRCRGNRRREGCGKGRRQVSGKGLCELCGGSETHWHVLGSVPSKVVWQSGGGCGRRHCSMQSSVPPSPPQFVWHTQIGHLMHWWSQVRLL